MALGVELANVKMSMNRFDEIAIEEAIRLKEAGKATEIIAVSVGPQRVFRGDTNRAYLWVPTRDILVKVDSRGGAATTIAKMLKAIADAEKPGLVIMGKQAIDDDCNTTSQMLAALTGWPQGVSRQACWSMATCAGHARG